MAVSDRVAYGVLALVTAVLLGAALGFDLPAEAEHQFWSDGSTYYAMAWSLAEDLDLRYEPKDLARVQQRYGGDPQGIFLKRTWGDLSWDPAAGFPWLRPAPVDVDHRPIYFAKAFAYPAFVAPFVAALGDRGFLVANCVLLALAVALAYTELRRQASPGRALATTGALYVASITPLYLLWMTPEIFNLALVAAGLWAWRRDRPLWAAVLLGLATYSKPYNVWLALPLGLAPLLTRDRARLIQGFLESLRRGAVMAATVLLLFGLNWVLTGEVNYQGGERKTFYGRFPFESTEITFGNSGQWMTTDHLGPLVEGQHDELVSRRTGPPRAAYELRTSFARNLGYFWVGRFAGVLAYYPGAFAALLLFLLAGPRTREGWLSLAALLAGFLFYIQMIPDNWYGGGGTVGNRYFLNLLPLAVLLVPRRREWVVASFALLGGIVFLAPALWSPLAHSLHPGRHAARAPFRLLPAELTMLNDLSAFTEPWRKKRSVGDTEGDPWRNWPADPKAYYLYFPDDGTYGLEGGERRQGFWVKGESAEEGRQGFWLRGGEPAEIILRALEPVVRMKIELRGGPAGDVVSLASAENEVRVAAGRTTLLEHSPGRGFPYYDTFLYVLHFRSKGPGAVVAGRRLGAFVRIRLEVARRPRPPAAR
jgi:hypothetical protein